MDEFDHMIEEGAYLERQGLTRINAEAFKGLALRDLPLLMELLTRVHANLVALETLHLESARPRKAAATGA